MPGIKRAEEILEEFGYTFLLVSDETVDKISKFKNKWNFDFNFVKATKSFETWTQHIDLPTLPWINDYRAYWKCTYHKEGHN